MGVIPRLPGVCGYLVCVVPLSPFNVYAWFATFVFRCLGANGHGAF